MTCNQATTHLTALERLETHDKVPFLRHIRSCPNCRKKVSAEEMVRAVNMVVMSEE